MGDASIDLVAAKHLELNVSAAGELRNLDFAKLKRLMRGAAIDADVYFNRHNMFVPSAQPKRGIGVLFCSGYLTDDPSSDGSWLAGYLAKIQQIDHDVMTRSFPPSARAALLEPALPRCRYARKAGEDGACYGVARCPKSRRQPSHMTNCSTLLASAHRAAQGAVSGWFSNIHAERSR